MTRPLIIFGAGDMGELAYHYFTNDSNYKVRAFVVDAAFFRVAEFCGKPVVSSDEAFGRFPSSDYDFFIAFGYSGVNKNRKQKYHDLKVRGYRLASYISSRATILNDSKIGDNCFILENNTIQPFSIIGNNVTMWSGNHLGHHSVIGDHCFISSHVVISGRVNVSERCFFGVNATVRDNIKIGIGSVIGAGSIILTDVADEGVYSPAETPRSKVPSGRLRKI